jgi:hypothetical protein
VTALVGALSGGSSIEGWLLEDYIDAIDFLEASGRSVRLGIIGRTVPRELWCEDLIREQSIDSFDCLM